MLVTIQFAFVLMVGSWSASASMQRSKFQEESEGSNKVKGLLELIESLVKRKNNEQVHWNNKQKKWCQSYYENGQYKQKCGTGADAGVQQILLDQWWGSWSHCSSSCSEGTRYRFQSCKYSDGRGRTYVERCGSGLIDNCKQEGCPWCFPGNATVLTPTGQKLMQDIAIGDYILAKLDDSKIGYTEVIAHAQRNPDVPIGVLTITAERSSPLKRKYQLQLTSTHNVFVKKSTSNDKFKAIFAKHVKVGDEVSFRLWSIVNCLLEVILYYKIVFW